YRQYCTISLHRGYYTYRGVTSPFGVRALFPAPLTLRVQLPFDKEHFERTRERNILKSIVELHQDRMS
ncbi:unnamed protein product, partial [Ixodes pacificus]